MEFKTNYIDVLIESVHGKTFRNYLDRHKNAVIVHDLVKKRIYTILFKRTSMGVCGECKINNISDDERAFMVNDDHLISSIINRAVGYALIDENGEVKRRD